MALEDDFYSWAEFAAAADASMEERRCRDRVAPHQPDGPGSDDLRTWTGAELSRWLEQHLVIDHHYEDEL